jgi:hypothetical protein
VARKNEVTGEWKRLRNEELIDPTFSIIILYE